VDLTAEFQEDLGEAGERLDYRVDLEQDEVLPDPLEVVEHVVDVDCDGTDILAIERGDEGGVQGLEHAAGDLVALVLDRLEFDQLDPAGLEVAGVGDVQEALGGPHEIARVDIEQLLEPLLPGHQLSNQGIESHGSVRTEKYHP